MNLRVPIILFVTALPVSAAAEEYNGKFHDIPITLQVNPVGSEKPFRVVDGFRFEDPNTLEWAVPGGANTDGATIPWLFEIMTGDNFDPAYLPAAVVHDYYCCVQTRTAHDTHRNFYYAMLANNTPAWKVWSMYTAVRLLGPDWVLTQAKADASGLTCFDEADIAQSPSGLLPGDAAASLTMPLGSGSITGFASALARAESEKNLFVISKLRAVARTLQSTNGEYIDVTSDGKIPATFEGVEKLKENLDNIFSFESYRPSLEKVDYSPIGLVVPLGEEPIATIEEIKKDGGILRTEVAWSSEELALLGVKGADGLPASLDSGYLSNLEAGDQLKGSGLDWLHAGDVEERSDWLRAIEAHRSYQDWKKLVPEIRN